MVVDLPKELETALRIKANAQGVSPAGYVSTIIRRDLAANSGTQAAYKPYKTGFGSLAEFGTAPSSKEIEENRADMFRGFGESL